MDHIRFALCIFPDKRDEVEYVDVNDIVDWDVISSNNKIKDCRNMVVYVRWPGEAGKKFLKTKKTNNNGQAVTESDVVKAQIIRLGDNRVVLKPFMDQLINEDDSEIVSRTPDLSSRTLKRPARLISSSDSEEEEEDTSKKVNEKKKKQASYKKTNAMVAKSLTEQMIKATAKTTSKEFISNADSDAEVEDRRFIDLQVKYHQAKAQIKNLQAQLALNTELPALLNQMRNLSRSPSPASCSSNFELKPPPTQMKLPSVPESTMTNAGAGPAEAPNLGIEIDEKSIKRAVTFKKLVCMLMTRKYTQEQMCQMSLTGDSRQGEAKASFENETYYKRLLEYVQSQFPNAKIMEIRSCISEKLSNEMKAQKKP